MSAVALAKAISGDTLIGLPEKHPRAPAKLSAPAPAPAKTPPLRTAAPAPVRPPDHPVTPPPAATNPTTPPMPANPAPVYTGPAPGSSAGVIRAFTLMVKFSIAAGIIGGIGYFTLTSVVPVLKEMSNPSPVSAGVDKDAPVFVQAIQQTRQVVAKNDANVARLDAILADPTGTGSIEPPAPSGQLAAAPGPEALAGDPNQQPIPDSAFIGAPAEPVKVSIYAPGSPIEVNFTKFPGSDLSDALMELMAARVTGFQINGIRHGTTPRIVVGGVLFKPGDMIDFQLELTFAGIDTRKRMLRFETAKGDLITRTY
ncbi:MAG: hypothetical protein ABII82_18165 [Verrucomicrobiota bacterium]